MLLLSTPHREPHVYRSIYLSESLVNAVNELAYKYDVSFNYVVTSMIRACLDEGREQEPLVP